MDVENENAAVSLIAQSFIRRVETLNNGIRRGECVEVRHHCFTWIPSNQAEGETPVVLLHPRVAASSRLLCDPNTHQNLHRLVTVTDGDVGGNLFVTADTEGTHGVTGLGEDRLLAGELLQHLKIEKKNAKRSRRQSLRSFALRCARSSQTTPSRAGIPRANLL